MHSFDLKIDEISKIEGKAALEIKIRGGVVEDLEFKITEFKRFYTQAIRGKHITAIPQLVARICGTCSNAHLLASIEAIEKGLGVLVTEQTKKLRKLLNYGLIIRDHALHLYIFALPDVLGKESILAFNESNPQEHELLEDAFAVKTAGNWLSVAVGGRSVHAPFPVPGGFLKIPQKDDFSYVVEQLKAVRLKVLKLVKIFAEQPFSLIEKAVFVGLSDPEYAFLEGKLLTSKGAVIDEADFGRHLEHLVIPYSEASGYRFEGEIFMVGALARMNLSRQNLHQNTQDDTAFALKMFPSGDIFHNNLAQSIEILHAIDSSLELIENFEPREEKPVGVIPKSAVGVGVIEAPRGTLYYKLHIRADGVIEKGDIIVPTGQNQICIERSIKTLVESYCQRSDSAKGQTFVGNRPELEFEIEKLIRAYDPCLSCAAHFLEVKWR